MEHPLYYLWYGPKHKIGFLWRSRIKKLWFRLRRGFWPSECWNLDITFAKFMVPRLEHFRKVTHGYPAGLEGPEEWDKILRRIIWSFNWAAADTENEGWWAKRYCLDPQHRKRVDKRYEAGMQLFAKYYAGLWD
jgi:hypothetical protein